MNNEIKEMMEQMENIAITGKNKNGIKVDGYGLQQKELKMFLDYINNLQKLCNKYEEEHNTTFKEWQKDIRANRKTKEYIENYDVFKKFTFPLMKKWEENQVKSSIDYQFKNDLKKNLINLLEGNNEYNK